MAIEQLPGQWSWLENLGTALGKQRQNQALFQDQQRQQAADRANTLAQFAQAGVLDPNYLDAQAAADLDRLGIPKQSILNINTNAINARKAKQAEAQQTSEKLRVDMERIRAQTALDRARTDQLKTPKPPDIKDEIARRKALESAAYDYWKGNRKNTSKALNLMKADKLFAGAPDEMLLSYINSAAAQDADKRRGPAEPKTTTPGSNVRTDAAKAVIQSAMQQLESAGLPRDMNDEFYKRSVLNGALQILGGDPGGRKLIQSGMSHADLLTGWDDLRKQAEKEAKGLGGLVIPGINDGGSSQSVDEKSLPDADLWEKKVGEGMSPDKATAYVKSRRR